MSAVLVVRPSSLGDIVHALALVADVHEKVPGNRSRLVAEEDFAPLVALHPARAAHRARRAASMAEPLAPLRRGGRWRRFATTFAATTTSRFWTCRNKLKAR
jgi:heptosyltransferase-1